MGCDRFIAGGNDGYKMLKDIAGVTRTPGLQSEYEAVEEYLAVLQQRTHSTLPGENIVHAAIDFASEFHNVKCPATTMRNSHRICQMPDLVVLKLGIYCNVATDSSGATDATALQECDTAYHAVDVINNKNDGLLDDILPYARIEVNSEHASIPCGEGQGAAAQAAWKRLNTFFGNGDGSSSSSSGSSVSESFYATIGPYCSGDVAAVTNAEWRAANNASQVVLSQASSASMLADDQKYVNLARLVTSERGVNIGAAALCNLYGWKRVAIVHENTVWGTDSAMQFERAMLESDDDSAESNLLYTHFGGLNRTQCVGDELNSERGNKTKSGAQRTRIVEPAKGCDPATSFDYDSMVYNDKDQCSGGFCAENILEELVKLDAQVVFLSLSPRLQRHFYRAVYLNRDVPGRKMHGKDFAFISGWLRSDVIMDHSGKDIDLIAAQGALGVLGLHDSYKKPGDGASDNGGGGGGGGDGATAATRAPLTLFEKYTALWQASSSSSACCDPTYNRAAVAYTIDQVNDGSSNSSSIVRGGGGAGGAGGGSSDSNGRAKCTRLAALDETAMGGPYCDADGDAASPAGYSFQAFDAVLMFALAMDANNLFRQPTSATLYESILKLPPFEGVTGPVILDPNSGDRLGNLEILNVQRSSDIETTPRAEDFAVLPVGEYSFPAGVSGDASATAARELVLDASATVQFPGKESTPPSDYKEPPPSPDNSGKIAMVAILSVFGAALVAIASHKAHEHILSLRPVDFQARFERMLKDGEITEEQLHASDEQAPREIKRSHLEFVMEIGTGQFGEVWKCILSEGGDHPPYTVAAKTVIDNEASQAATDELLAEAAVMSQVGSHENLVSIIGVITSGLPLVLILSYCEYGSVLTFLRKKFADGLPISYEAKLQMAIEMTEGMAHLASRSFIHRDLAARNVLLGAGRSVDDNRRNSTIGMVCKIADFGLSRAGKDGSDVDDVAADSESEAYYRSSNGIFPVRWTAPESMETLKFSTASDVWSWAIVVIELLQDGRQPYDGMSNPSVMTLVLAGRVHPQIRKCPNALYKVLEMCWDAEPSTRPDFRTLSCILKEHCDDVRASAIWGPSAPAMPLRSSARYVARAGATIESIRRGAAHYVDFGVRRSSFEITQTNKQTPGFVDEVSRGESAGTTRSRTSTSSVHSNALDYRRSADPYGETVFPELAEQHSTVSARNMLSESQYDQHTSADAYDGMVFSELTASATLRRRGSFQRGDNVIRDDEILDDDGYIMPRHASAPEIRGTVGARNSYFVSPLETHAAESSPPKGRTASRRGSAASTSSEYESHLPVPRSASMPPRGPASNTAIWRVKSHFEADISANGDSNSSTPPQRRRSPVPTDAVPFEDMLLSSALRNSSSVQLDVQPSRSLTAAGNNYGSLSERQVALIVKEAADGRGNTGNKASASATAATPARSISDGLASSKANTLVAEKHDNDDTNTYGLQQSPRLTPPAAAAQAATVIVGGVTTTHSTTDSKLNTASTPVPPPVAPRSSLQNVDISPIIFCTKSAHAHALSPKTSNAKNIETSLQEKALAATSHASLPAAQLPLLPIAAADQAKEQAHDGEPDHSGPTAGSCKSIVDAWVDGGAIQPMRGSGTGTLVFAVQKVTHL